MQRLAEICIRKPVFATMLILSLVVVGGASYVNLDVDRFPAVDLRGVRVATRLRGASPADGEARVSLPIEEGGIAVEGCLVRHVAGHRVASIGRHFIDLNAQRLWQPVRAFEKTGSFTGHDVFLHVVDQLRGVCATRFTDSL